MENPASGEPQQQQCCEDVRKSGYLRKQKSMHRRYFVLRTASERGAARLEYYESEKKFRGKAPIPKKALALETCFNINKRADAKNKHMIVLYTRAESFAVAAENEADQDEWYQAMVDLQCKSKSLVDNNNGDETTTAAVTVAATATGDYGAAAAVPNPGPAFKEVWQVKVWPKGLGQAKNLVGIYRLCLTDKTVNFVKLHSDAAAVVLQLMNVRRCGHSENFFFVEVGRSAVTGPGEFWMQVDDSVVAQNMHESLLEAMKALSDEFRQRSKSQSSSGPGGGATASNPISVPSRRHHPNPPPSQVGFTRRSRTEPPIGGGGGVGSANASPTPRHSLPRSRTASDAAKGEEGAAGGGCPGPQGPPGSSPAANGSCSGTPILRSKSARSAPVPATKTPLGLMRSVSTPAPSPAASLSSSSGHGSEFGGAGAPVPAHTGAVSGPYGRVPSHRASVSGSPSDYGSSDEYGSSPGEHCLLPSPGLGPGSLGSVGGRSLDEEGANYILMGGARGGGATEGASAASSLASQDGGVCTPPTQPQTKRVLRRSSSRESEAERRLLSKRASLPPMALERLAPRQRRSEGPAAPPPEEEDSADYAIMSRSTSRESFTSSASSSCTQRDSGVVSGSSVGGGGYLDVAGGEFRGEGGVATTAAATGGVGLGVDNGYMSMLPGVSQPPGSLAASFPDGESPSAKILADDYMAMTPNNSVSPPQPIRPPHASDGYMMMSPHSSCSPEQRGGAWPSSSDSRAGSDYMNMSPISARSVHGSPPASELHLGQSDPHHAHAQQGQPGPKMVYSYYSLPRSYKHNPSKGHFEEGPARGRRPNEAVSSSGRGTGGGSSGGDGGLASGGGRPEPAAAGSSVTVGRHLSLSSSSYSSYSSSSASNESLGGESEERTPKGPPSGPLKGTPSKEANGGGGGLQQRRGGGGGGSAASKQGSHARNRPVSLFVDVSKANTLPRVRENPLPPEPKSPGEYVSIEFKGLEKNGGGGRGGGLRHGPSTPTQPGRLRPASGCLPLSRSPSAPLTPPLPTVTVASEYVNMDLGPSPSPSPLSLTSLGFPSFHTPPTPPTLAHTPKSRSQAPGVPCQEDEEVVVVVATGGGGGPVRRKSRESVPSVSESESSPSCGDYTEMVFGLKREAAASTRVTSSTFPAKAPSPTRPAPPTILGLPLGLDFPLAKPLPNPDHGAKVIRADLQGRRRHCSETFLASTSSGPAPSSSTSASSSSSSSSSSTASLFPEHAQAVARRHGFEGMLWGNNNGSGGLSDPPGQFHLPGQQPPPVTQALCTEQGLNYIDLDLANKESPHPAADGPSGIQAAPSRLFAMLGGGSGSGGGGAGGGGGGGAAGVGSSSSGASLNTYASIDFYKSDELRSHQNGSKEGTELCYTPTH
ncbi:unnamed protein product [Merluccius merluccius]